MPKQKITISLDSEIARKLRIQSVEKYGDSRSLSHLIEDLAMGEVQSEDKGSEACSILGHRSEYSLKEEKEFKKIVEEITNTLSDMKLSRSVNGQDFLIAGPALYFSLKEAFELEMNRVADEVNKCPGCKGLNGPLPKYPEAGKNFAIYATMDTNLR